MDKTRRCIVALSGRETLLPHDREPHEALCRHLSKILDWPYEGWFSAGQEYPELPYFLPFETLSTDEAADWGVSSADSLLGGVVPHPFVATKSVAHPLVPGAVASPAGWNPALGPQIAAYTLPGYSAFSKSDVYRAIERLLPLGPVRLKCAASRGGVGQAVISDAGRDSAFVEVLEPDVLAAGVAAEVNLGELRTISIGEVDLPGMTLAYHGEQRLTRTEDGTSVYGGSYLHVFRGNLAQLAQNHLPPGISDAIAAALGYERSVMDAFPGVFASRRNYDVAIGSQDSGNEHVAVLEHSWRVGGASAAEIAAYEALLNAPSEQWVEAYTCELYGEGTPPANAQVLFQGNVPGNGKLTKYCGVSMRGRET
ncbi:DUF3182 family protein [Pseudoxanthomonas sp. UTMC 1351]|uniref:DUF3182 family protein n=1 Tax=Pseudoxanthomonas sp. UTMC 1351 TaxID=2695853 RepID=UPI0034CF8118